MQGEKHKNPPQLV